MAHSQQSRGSRRTAVVLAVVAGTLPFLAATAPVAPAAAAAPLSPGAITLAVTSAGSGVAGTVPEGTPVTHYRWLVNEDDTGDPGTLADQGTERCLPPQPAGSAQQGSADPDFVASCPWPSIRPTSGFAPIVAQGDETTLGTSTALRDLPGGRYLISVTADGYKIDGQHFTVDGGTQQVAVAMNPTPLPLATMRIQVFDDTVPVDATYEADAEAGLQGFVGHLTDVFGEVSTDYYGNALCTTYLHIADGSMRFDADTGKPVVDPSSTGRCVSDATGQIVIPNLGPNRYAATVTPPAGQADQWVQTTTLEGAKDWDTWVQEGETGYDNEVLKGGEPVPLVQFGFVRRTPMPASSATGEITGVIVAGLPYIGGTPGLAYETGFPYTRSDGPISRPWIALNDLDAGDAARYVGQGNADGSFDLTHVPDGSYQLSAWDDNLDYILYSFNVQVSGGQVTDVGNTALTAWFSHLHGHVFVDSNENGQRDPGESSVPGFTLTVRERDNSLMDQYTNTATTNDNGYYDIRETYPLGKWLVLEAFNTRYRTTGITYRGENEDQPTTKLGSLVDLDFLPIIGLGGEIDWGVQPYTAAENGGIVGTVSYDTTRNELDPADAASESYQPGIPGVPVRLYAALPCSETTPADVAAHCRQGKELTADGSIARSPELQDAYTSEEWAAPHGCTAYDAQGVPLTDQRALPAFGETIGSDPNDPNTAPTCAEAPMMGIAIGPSDKTDGAASQTVNGNYGFATSRLNLYPPGSAKNPAPAHDLPLYADLAAAGYPEQDLRPGDYVVSVDIPDNPVGGGKMYQATQEEDVNVFDGDTYLPQENTGTAAAAAAADGGAPPPPDVTPPTQPPSQQAGIISPCAGALHTVTVTDQAFLDGGGSPFEGQQRPSCADKLVTVRAAQATAPNFNLFTPVPIPTHFWGVTLNDLGLTFDKRSVNYGEAQGLPFVPVGLYDWAGHLKDTVHTDFNGLYEGLEPSTSTYNCPVPAGPCPNMYRFVGNDPGTPDHLNPDYNPAFRTIAASFQGWPGLFTVTDEAPTQVANVALAPDGTIANPTQCDLGKGFAQLLSVDRPFVRTTGSAADRTITITGLNLGTAGTLKVGGTTVGTSTWTANRIVATIPSSGVGTGAISIAPSAPAGIKPAYNTMTLQVVGSASAAVSATNPRVVTVNPYAPLVTTGTNRNYATVQDALEFARPTSTTPYWLVAVYPNKASRTNPRGEYTENLIVHHRVRIQGTGPGGFLPSGTPVPGSILDGIAYSPDNDLGTAWLNLLGRISYSGDPQVPDSAVVTFLRDTRDSRTLGYDPTLDGFLITGGSQSDVTTNINTITGGVSTPYGATGALVTQGGGVYVHNGVRNLTVSDDVIRGNSGSYGGAVRVGTPYVGSNDNAGFVLTRNQLRENGGTNLAGGVGIFAGADGYQVTNNAICGNFSAEYGGGVSVFGYQGGPNDANPAVGTISRNRVWFNASYDEGGGLFVAGELTADPTQLTQGSGPVSIDHNIVESNLSNDDGGGIRLLMVTGRHATVVNPTTGTTAQREQQRSNARGTISIVDDTVTDNLSAHEGGGIALDDAAFVNVVDTTVARNVTTATAVTSDGTPAPAGLSTATNSDPLRARLTSRFAGTAAATTPYSKPVLLDDVFWDNRAGRYEDATVKGIGALANGQTYDVNVWDLGSLDPVTLSPKGSVIDSVTQTDVPAGGNATTRVVHASEFRSPWLLPVDVLPSRTYPAFREAAVVAAVLPPPDQMGDYHLLPVRLSPFYSPPALGQGLASTSVAGTGGYPVNAASDDLDGDSRPGFLNHYEAGSDQLTP